MAKKKLIPFSQLANKPRYTALLDKFNRRGYTLKQLEKMKYLEFKRKFKSKVGSNAAKDGQIRLLKRIKQSLDEVLEERWNNPKYYIRNRRVRRNEKIMFRQMLGIKIIRPQPIPKTKPKKSKSLNPYARTSDIKEAKTKKAYGLTKIYDIDNDKEVFIKAKDFKSYDEQVDAIMTNESPGKKQATGLSENLKVEFLGVFYKKDFLTEHVKQESKVLGANI